MLASDAPTEPVLHSAEEASAFARELQRILRYVGASEANMDMGQMRVEANISVAPVSQIEESSTDPKDRYKNLGVKCEVKNLNSFASVEGAINYEVARHIDLIERGEKVVQETLKAEPDLHDVSQDHVGAPSPRSFR